MDLNEIKALMDRFDTSACTVLELEEGNLRLRLEQGTAPVSVAPEIPAAPAAPQSKTGGFYHDGRNQVPDQLLQSPQA